MPVAVVPVSHKSQVQPFASQMHRSGRFHGFMGLAGFPQGRELWETLH